MDIKTNYLSVTKQARYSTYGALSEKTKYYWFVLHGSKMRCEQMLYKFSSFDPETHFVVAPEGLSRFYLDGFGGEVVSSWMTSRDRIKEIHDLSAYLTTLYEQYLDRMPKAVVKNILGFSQGGTIMFRWLHHSKVHFDHLIPYSCWLPEDINIAQSQSNLSSTILYTYGRSDQFLTKRKMDALKDLVKRNDLDVEFYPYEGDHRVDRAQIQFLFNHIRQ